MNGLHKIISIAIVTGILSLALALPAAAVIPVYTPSDEYIASPFHAALTELSLTGDGRYDTLAVAFTQLGYHEGDSEDELGGANTSGTRNFAEYNRLYGKLDNGEGNGMSYGYSWCAAFVSWCLRHADVDEKVALTEVSCRRMTDWYRAQDRFYSRQSGYLPLPGDLVMFHEGDGVPTHVGLVVGAARGRIHVIDGNGREGSVALHEYHRASAKIYGYCVPDYGTVPGTVYDFLPDTPIAVGTALALSAAAAAVILAVAALTAAVVVRMRKEK